MDATSEACPSRRAGIRSTILSFGTGALPGLRPSMIALSMRLSIRPGQTQFTRTPVAAHSSAALGQEPQGSGADNPGRAGDDCDRAVQTNSVGHGVRFLVLLRLFRISGGSAGGEPLIGSDYFICGAG
jgi:hypothetical protein